MPLNKLKKYPQLLDLSSLSEKERSLSLRGIFDRDITNNDNFSFGGKRIYPIKSDGIIDLEREFKHLTTENVEYTDEGGNKIKRRIYDSFRSERLHWLRTHVDNKVTDSQIHVFSCIERDFNKHVDVSRTYIYNMTQKYVIVLEPYRNNTSYYLLTAYYLNKSYGEKQIQKKMKSKIKDIL